MKYWRSKLYMAEMTRTLGHALLASLAFELSINCTETGIVQALFSGSLLLLILCGGLGSYVEASGLMRSEVRLTMVSGYSM